MLRKTKLFSLFTSLKKPVLATGKNSNVCDLRLLGEPDSFVQSVIVVNNLLNEEWLSKGLKSCQNIVLADGGANRFYQTPFRDNEKIRYIVGDLDSLKPDIRKYYEDRGVKVEQVWNQDTNDFQKSIQKSIQMGWNKICCFGTFGGRMDHTLSTMHLSTKLCRQYPELEVILFGKTNIMYFIRPNIPYKIFVPEDLEKRGCGLVTFGRVNEVQTKGFRWNLGPSQTHKSLEWGDFISTSNEIVKNYVEIITSDPIFFVNHFK